MSWPRESRVYVIGKQLASIICRLTLLLIADGAASNDRLFYPRWTDEPRPQRFLLIPIESLLDTPTLDVQRGMDARLTAVRPIKIILALSMESMLRHHAVRPCVALVS